MTPAHWSDEIEAGFEPPANASQLSSFSEAALCSLAISMKRIADEICDRPDHMGLTQILFYMEQRLGPQS